MVSQRRRLRVSNTQLASSSRMDKKLHLSRDPRSILPWSLASNSWAVQALHTALALLTRNCCAARSPKPQLSVLLGSALPHAQQKTKKERACGSGLSELRMARSSLRTNILFASLATAITSHLDAPGTLARTAIALSASKAGPTIE